MDDLSSGACSSHGPLHNVFSLLFAPQVEPEPAWTKRHLVAEHSTVRKLSGHELTVTLQTPVVKISCGEQNFENRAQRSMEFIVVFAWSVIQNNAQVLDESVDSSELKCSS